MIQLRNPKKFRTAAKDTIRSALTSIGERENVTSRYIEGVFTLTFEDEVFAVTFDERFPLTWDAFASKPRAYGEHDTDDDQG
jgi:hypothetical protein